MRNFTRRQIAVILGCVLAGPEVPTGVASVTTMQALRLATTVASGMPKSTNDHNLNGKCHRRRGYARGAATRRSRSDTARVTYMRPAECSPLFGTRRQPT